MADRMQQFHKIAQSYPELRDAATRTHDYAEIYRELTDGKAATQASRCLQCGVPFCQVHCPLSNNIPDWLKLTAEGRLRDAYDMAALTNTFPEICGRICPQDRLCEGNCVVEQADFGTITIGAIEKFITENAWKEGWITPFSPPQERHESVGIIGSGPAGLAAAEQLRKAGYQVTIYDRHDRAGGLLIYGIPNFKLEKEVVTRRREQYEQSGIRFHLNVDIGKEMPLQHLRKKHDAVLIATGVYQPRELDSLPGAELTGITRALDFLITSNKRGFGDSVPRFDSGELNAAGKKVVVIGGGDTAMDCVRTAVRQGTKKVTCLYRRDRENMPGSAREVKHAEAEGVEFRWLSAPHSFRGKGHVQEVMVQQMRLGNADPSGRRLPVAVQGEVYGLDADLVIKALGFDAEALPAMFDEPSLTVTAQGTLAVDRKLMTSLPGVFAAGDIVRGASLVVWAIADGREAAQGIMRYLEDRNTLALPLRGSGRSEAAPWGAV